MKLLNALTKLRILLILLIDGVIGSCKYWNDEIRKRDLDDVSCCTGHMCCCGGETIRQQWSGQNKIVEESFSFEDEPF